MDDVPGRLVVAVAVLVLEVIVVFLVAPAVPRPRQLHMASVATSNGDEVDVAGPAGRWVARAVRGGELVDEAAEHGHGAGDDAQVALEDCEEDDFADLVCEGQLWIFGLALVDAQYRLVGVVYAHV